MSEAKASTPKESWNHGIVETRKQKRSHLQASPEATHDDEIPVPTPEENLNNLSVKQLREIIKEKGLRPKGLSKLKNKKKNFLNSLKSLKHSYKVN